MSATNPFDLAGKAAIVTGAARGIGFAIARRFVELGADVLIADIDGPTLGEAGAIALAARGTARVETMTVDVSDDGAGAWMVARCVAAFGKLDVLVNNAGLFQQVPMLETTPELFDRTYQVNLRAVALASKAAGMRFVEQGGGGKIVNIASIDALRPSFPGLAAYDASKGGVLMFTRSFALEMARHGVRVNAIAPGAIATEGAAAGVAPDHRDEAAAWVRTRIPLGRIGTPDDVANAAAFLASSASDYMTGSLLVVDGGILLT
jgi:2-deoxy-D-gluconate 3-dehydrogenase